MNEKRQMKAGLFGQEIYSNLSQVQRFGKEHLTMNDPWVKYCRISHPYVLVLVSPPLAKPPPRSPPTTPPLPTEERGAV